jgi:small subunit ribosomal protein S2
MAPYIYGERDGVHIFDLAQTATGLAQAGQMLFDAAKEGKNVVFVGTKRQAQAIVKEEATNAGAMFITTRWPGGLLTNWEQVGKSVKKLGTMKRGAVGSIKLLVASLAKAYKEGKAAGVKV